ncbi:unnamed protein product [Amoebophrya sp. A120]|nr:unnamed protein product [Amoebophrya sp. A120]|eukprot:GSA120T00023642001.1
MGRPFRIHMLTTSNSIHHIAFILLLFLRIQSSSLLDIMRSLFSVFTSPSCLWMLVGHLVYCLVTGKPVMKESKRSEWFRNFFYLLYHGFWSLHVRGYCSRAG